MKIRLLLIGFISFALAIPAFSQGTITFRSSTTALVQIKDLILTGGNTVNATSATYGTRLQLYYEPNNGGNAPTALDLSSAYTGFGGWTAIGSLATIASNGRFNLAGLLTTGNDVAPGANVWLMVAGWNNSYTSLQEAYANANNLEECFAFTTVWTQSTGGDNSGGLFPPIAPVPTTAFFPGMVLVPPTPEPSVICLTGVGALAMFFSRRRK